MDIKVTEVSLSFQVTKPPRTHVGKNMSIFVSTIGEDIERVIPSVLQTELPWWVTDPQPNTVRFLYSSSVQDVECSYSLARSAITFQGIKQKNVDEFNEHINEVLRLLKTEPVGVPATKYKAVARTDIHVPWDVDVLADIITNNPDVAQTMAMCERTSTLGGRRLFSVVADVGDNRVCRIAITCRDGQVSAMISKLPDEDASIRVADKLRELFVVYGESLSTLRTDAIPRYETVSGIGALREKLPELFVNNYTRECPVLPVMISKEEAERIRHTQRVILYPLNSNKGRYYTAPEGYFVGLKRNRLANKGEFSCLVTCYLQDHIERKGSETYKYYNSATDPVLAPLTRANDCAATAEAVSTPKKRPLPKSISNPEYHRKRAYSFVDAVESAAGIKFPLSLPWCPQIVKQELWGWSDDEIMSAIRKGNEAGSRLYRYFEELAEVSIHVVTIADGNFEPLVPPHRGKYVWAPPYPLHIVIFETYKTTYGNKTCSYDFLANNSTTLFDRDDSVVSYLISQKGADAVPPADIPDGVCKQVVDRNGKCSSVTSEDGSYLLTYTRPLSVPVASEPACFLDSHVRKMNAAKQELGLNPIDLSKRSSNDILYFPNNASFEYYVSAGKGNSA